MYKHQAQVREFMTKMQQVMNDKPTIPSEEILKLGCKLLLEEVLEFCTAAGYSVDATNDGIGDSANEIEIW
jgi:predicted HAD superfamily Cof-like phosphohydrolase